jgi:hypothetical protein
MPPEFPEEPDEPELPLVPELPLLPELPEVPPEVPLEEPVLGTTGAGVPLLLELELLLLEVLVPEEAIAAPHCLNP